MAVMRFYLSRIYARLAALMPKIENSLAALNAGVKQVVITKADTLGSQTGTKILAE